jgi:hypothetical protein
MEAIVRISVPAGIRINVIATCNLFVEEAVASNPAGIDFIATATASATGNTLRENTIVSNASG